MLLAVALLVTVVALVYVFMYLNRGALSSPKALQVVAAPCPA